MKFILHKCSIPVWNKSFSSLQDATNELRKHICKDCLEGDDEIFKDENGVVLTASDEASPHTKIWPGFKPNPNSIRDLLTTTCGIEFELEWPNKDEEEDELDED